MVEWMPSVLTGSGELTLDPIPAVDDDPAKAWETLADQLQALLDDSIDETVAAEMLAGMEPMDEMLRSSGHYGARVEVDDAADVVTRLIAFTGRNPHWSP